MLVANEYNTNYPILYSFRRCPYAIRARMALYASGQTCELREVLLKNKPVDMITISPKANLTDELGCSLPPISIMYLFKPRDCVAVEVR